MGAVGFVARTAIRRQRRSIIAIALLVGIVGAVVLASAAGARRTSSSLTRFEHYSRSSQLEIQAGTTTRAEVARFRREPDVVAVAELYQMTLTLRDGTFLPLAAAVDGRFGTEVDRAYVVRGRLQHPSAPLDLDVGETLAARLHLHVGSTATLPSYSVAQVERALTTDADPGPPSGPNVHFKIVGIVRRPLDLGVRGGPGGVAVHTPAFLHRYRSQIGSFGGTILRVRTARAAGAIVKVEDEARAIFGKDDRFTVQELGVETKGASDAVNVLTVALWIFAAIALASGLVAITIAVGRQVASEDRDQQILSSLGLTRVERAVASGAIALPVAVLGTLLALIGAASLSPLLPFGVARKADIDAGFHVDALVFTLGALALVAIVTLIGTVAGFRVAQTGTARSSLRPSTAARIAEGVGVAPTVAAGMRLALEPGRARTAVPVRSAFFGAAFGVLGVVAILIFSSSLDHLAATPKLYGWTFDAVVTPETQLSTSAAVEADASRHCSTAQRNVVDDRHFGAFAVYCNLTVTVGGHGTQAWALRSLRGTIDPAVVGGHEPRGSREVALGASTLGTLGKHLGDTVTIRAAGTTQRFRIVGTVAFPSPATIDAQSVSDGAALAPAGMLRLANTRSANFNTFTTYYVARLTPRVHPYALPRGPQGFHRLPVGDLVLPTVAVEVARIQQVDNLPTILGALLALLAIIAVGHSIVLAGSRRRRDLAMLRALGFRRSQVRSTVLTQATTHAVLGLLVGIPLGIAAGRLFWRAVADNLGVKAEITVPVLALVLVAAGALLVTNAIGLLGARAGLRAKPAVVLRTE